MSRKVLRWRSGPGDAREALGLVVWPARRLSFPKCERPPGRRAEIAVLIAERARSLQRGALLRSWLGDHALSVFADRILPVDTVVARRSPVFPYLVHGDSRQTDRRHGPRPRHAHRHAQRRGFRANRRTTSRSLVDDRGVAITIESVHLFARIRILCHTFPNRRIETAPCEAAGPRRKERKNAFETFGIEPETRSDFFIWNRRNPLKSPDSDE
jgi:hypothetical protein